MADEDVFSELELHVVTMAMEWGYLPQSDDITRLDKINALEIIGARFILFSDQDVELFQVGFRNWRRALTLRLMDRDDGPPVYKTPLKSKNEQLTEWGTLEDLQRIEQNPAHCRIQALLVWLRSFSSMSWSAVHRHFIGLFSRFFVVKHEGSITEFLDFTWLTLDVILSSERPHESCLLDSVFEIGHTLSLKLHRLEEDDPQLNSGNLTKLAELCLMMYPFHVTDLKIRASVVEIRQMEQMMSMFLILSRNPELITNETRLGLLQLVHRDDRDSSGFNLLLTVCFYLPEGSALPTIRFLVKLGANLNATNNVGDGVLHLLAQQPGSETRDAAARLLLELGAHLDMVNNARMTPADLWFQKNTPEKRDVADLPDWLKEGVPKLMCLSSRVIRRHQMPYDDGAILPVSLIPFVTLH